MSPRPPGAAASPPAGAPIDRRGRSADSRRVALAVDARRDSPKSSSCSRAARTWAARARSRESSQARVRGRPRAAAVPAPVVGRPPSDHFAAQLLVLGQRDQVATERGLASSTGPFVVTKPPPAGLGPPDGPMVLGSDLGRQGRGAGAHLRELRARAAHALLARSFETQAVNTSSTAAEGTMTMLTSRGTENYMSKDEASYREEATACRTSSKTCFDTTGPSAQASTKQARTARRAAE